MHPSTCQQPCVATTLCQRQHPQLLRQSSSHVPLSHPLKLMTRSKEETACSWVRTLSSDSSHHLVQWWRTAVTSRADSEAQMKVSCSATGDSSTLVFASTTSAGTADTRYVCTRLVVATVRLSSRKARSDSCPTQLMMHLLRDSACHLPSAPVPTHRTQGSAA